MMPPLKRAVRPLPLLVLALLAGCFSLGRKVPPLERYVLGSVRGEEGIAASLDSAGPAIAVRRLDLAAYLATPDVVVREGPQRIVASEFHRWGEDLGEGINRALAGYLRDRGGFGRVDVAPWAPATEHDYRVQVHVLRFEGVVPREGAVTGEAHLLATWEIMRPADGAVVVRGTTDYRGPGWTAGNYASLVALLDRGVYRLANDVARGIADLSAGS